MKLNKKGYDNPKITICNLFSKDIMTLSGEGIIDFDKDWLTGIGGGSNE